MTTLHIMRGLPGSGKSSLVDNVIDDDAVWLGRDILRRTMFGADGVLPQPEEEAITKALRRAVGANLAVGFDVWLDSQHLRDREVREWMRVALDNGCGYEIHDLRGEPLDSVLRQNAGRIKPVPEDYIRRQHARFIAGRDLTEVLMPTEGSANSTVASQTKQKYVKDESLPDAILCDLDGTLCNHEGIRDPYDTTRYHLDTVHEEVDEVITALWARGVKVLFTTGRDEIYRDVTEAWLNNVAGYGHDYELLMRPHQPDGEPKIKDSVVKENLFWTAIAPRYNVLGVFDDRPSVCRLWRSIGVFTFQVGDPHVEF